MRMVQLPSDVATGADGSATVTVRTNGAVVGKVLAVGVVCKAEVGGDASAVPGSTTVTVRTVGYDVSFRPSAPPSVPILTRAASAANSWDQPFVLKQDVVGTDIAAQYVEPVIADQVEAVIANANTNNTFIVTLVVED